MIKFEVHTREEFEEISSNPTEEKYEEYPYIESPEKDDLILIVAFINNVQKGYSWSETLKEAFLWSNGYNQALEAQQNIMEDAMNAIWSE